MSKPGSPPTEASLHDAALAHLSRYAASRAALIKVLDRRCERWARAAEATEALPVLRQAVRAVVARLVEAGVVNDAAFAAGRVRSLGRSGRSRRAIAAHLAARGVAGDDASLALPDDPEAELAAALALARRRRLGPFRDKDAAADPRRELGVLARAGFPQDIAERALRTDPDTAAAVVARLRRG
jgi:regulatory protein